MFFDIIIVYCFMFLTLMLFIAIPKYLRNTRSPTAKEWGNDYMNLLNINKILN